MFKNMIKNVWKYRMINYIDTRGNKNDRGGRDDWPSVASASFPYLANHHCRSFILFSFSLSSG